MTTIGATTDIGTLYAMSAPEPRKGGLFPNMSSTARTLLIVVLVVFVVIVWFVANNNRQGSSSSNSNSDSKPAVVDQRTDLEIALAECKLVGNAAAQLTDAGYTLLLDMKGETQAEGLSPDDVACVLGKTGVSGAVIAKMEATRALDGQQTDTWGSYTATWSYHPDNGLDIILEQF